MTLLLFNVLLAICYACLVGFSPLNLVIGFMISFCILVILPQLPNPKGFPGLRLNSGHKFFIFARNLMAFTLDFLWDLTVSNFQIAYEVWSPKNHYNPRLIEVPVGDLTNLQLTLLASRITLTPGTLSADVSEDRQILVVHAMFPGEGDAAAALRRPIDLLSKDL
jgi:multicomponent Na+:H+ antiporter subunit E